MRIDLPLPDLLAALVAGGAVVLGVAVGAAMLMRKGPGRRAAAFLGLFLVAAALTVLDAVVSALALHRLSNHLWVTPLLYTFALGPLLAGFVRARVEPGWRLGWRDVPHAVLPGWQILHELATGFAPLAVKEWYYQTPYARAFAALDTLVFIGSFGAYLVVAHRLARHASPSDRPWLARLVRGCAAILAVAVVLEAAAAWADRGDGFDWLELGALGAYASLLYWTALTGWVYALAPRGASPPPRQETYGITDDALATHVEALREHVRFARPYLDPELTLPSLAARLGLGDKELSYVLNAGLGVGYHDYVNRLRVEEVRRRLADLDEADTPVLAIGLAAGFASKATFNRVFKRETGRTPTAFRRGLTTS